MAKNKSGITKIQSDKPIGIAILDEELYFVFQGWFVNVMPTQMEVLGNRTYRLVHIREGSEISYIVPEHYLDDVSVKTGWF